MRFVWAGSTISSLFMQADAARSDTFVKFLAWLQVNQKRLILWGSILVAVIAIIGFTIYYQGQKEARAALAVSNVPMPSTPAVVPAPGTAEAYLKVAQEHGGTKAGSRALLLAGTTFFTESRYAEAQKAFEQFVREYPESPWVPQAHYGIASSLDAQQKTAEATAKFEEVRRRFGSDPIADEVKLALGRLYEAQNKPAEAHKLYSELLQSHQANPYSGMGNEAGLRKTDLEAKHPELARTNAPILTPQQFTFSSTNPVTPMNRTTTTTNTANTLTAVTNVPATTSSVPLLIQPGATTNKP